MKKAISKHRDVIIPVLFLFISGIIAFLLLPPAPVWISDSGNKYMIMRNLASHGSAEFLHPLPELFHYCGFHFQQIANGRIYSFFPEFFPRLTLPLWLAGGDGAVSVIPQLCGALTLFFTLKLAPRNIFPVTALAVASPLLFYSVQMWEMVPAAAAITAAAWLFRRKSLFSAGIVFGCSVWMREEVYLLGAALTVSMLMQKRHREIFPFALGVAIPVIILWGVNFHLYDNIFGLHGAKYFVNNAPESSFLPQKIRDVLFNFYQQLIRFETLPPAFAATSAVAAFTAGCVPDFTSWKKWKLLTCTIGGAVAVCSALYLWQSSDPLFSTVQTAGLLIGCPVMFPLLANWRALLKSPQKNISLAAWTLFIFIITLPFFLNPHDIGLTWGSRHCIIIMPLASVLSGYALCKNFRDTQIRHIIAALLLISGAIMQIWAVTALAEVSKKTAALDKMLCDAPGDVVVSDLFFLPEMTPHLPQKKLCLEITDSGRTQRLLNFLKQKKIPGFTLLLSPRYRRLPNPALTELFRAYPPAAQPEKYTITPAIEIFMVYCAKKP